MTLDGERWGISLEDIVASSYGDFLKNGKRNGYVSPLDRISTITNLS